RRSRPAPDAATTKKPTAGPDPALMCGNGPHGRAPVRTIVRRRMDSGRRRRQDVPQVVVQLAGQLPPDQRDRDLARGGELGHEALEGERVAELPPPIGQQALDLDLAGEVARPVGGLPEV